MEFKRKNCEHYFECRLPLDLCNSSCKKYRVGSWVKIKEQNRKAKFMKMYTNDHGKKCYKGVTPETPFTELEFHEVPGQMESDRQLALHTNLGSMTVLDRMTGYGGGIRDIETGYRDPDGKFWLASCNNDVRQSDATTMQDAIDWVKERANTCRGI